MGYKLLLVDDDRDLIKMLTHYFSRKGYEIRSAENGSAFAQ